MSTTIEYSKVRAKRNSFGVKTVERHGMDARVDGVLVRDAGGQHITYEVQVRPRGETVYPSYSVDRGVWACSCRTVMLGGTCEHITHATWYRRDFEAQS